ncbi:MAG: flavin reductase [Acidobacteria bacterium]|nr:MAG: flavin reductase [Acidobacteriota bacterium]REK00899.1 MAG: flavin reductase [Acidobacteriota bacterium]
MDSRDYRDTVGHFATGVTVVTTNVGGSLHGMTANAFCSVSLEPLLLLVCVDNLATCHGQVTAAGSFAINILAADQEDLSNLFAQRLLPVEARDGRLHGAPFRLDDHGEVLLDGCLAHFSCALHAVHDGGDHGIFVGRVREGAIHRPGEAPLLYYRGRYATTAAG